MIKWLDGKKTYIAAILLALQPFFSLLTGDMTLTQFLQSPGFTQLLAAFGLASLRHGVEKNGTGDGS